MPFLLTVIVLMIVSDPYIGGYGNQISYILWGVICSIIVLRLLYEIHLYLKRYTEAIFFVAEDDDVKHERFSNAKTWYGIAIIIFFILFFATAIIVALKIWGVSFSLQDFSQFVDFHLFKTSRIEKGEIVWFTPRKLALLVSFIISGFLVAILFNRLILQRIFAVLPVDLGIQNTILSLARYIIVIATIYIGFEWAGLSNLLFAIGIVVGSISYISKEPISDLISYFIILVQRPIQIGDYISISDDIQGVVRKITPRSVILRKKDSFSIVVPNSTILAHPVSNWHYSRNFVAVDDIEFTVAYTADAMQVKKIIQRVLDENIDILKSPKPIIRLNNLSEYGYVFMIRGFISNINILRRWDIASDIRFAIIKSFKEEGIRIAMPTWVMLDKYQ